jgi:hypothetical protein
VPVFKPPQVPKSPTNPKPKVNYNAARYNVQAVQSIGNQQLYDVRSAQDYQRPLPSLDELPLGQRIAVSVTEPFQPQLFGIKMKETTVLKELPGMAGWGAYNLLRPKFNPIHAAQEITPFTENPFIPSWLTAAGTSFNWGSGLLLQGAPTGTAKQTIGNRFESSQQQPFDYTYAPKQWNTGR